MREGTLSNIIRAYNLIVTPKHLKESGLTLFQYKGLCMSINELIEEQKAKTSVSSVAEWLKKRGCTVSEESGSFSIKI